MYTKPFLFPPGHRGWPFPNSVTNSGQWKGSGCGVCPSRLSFQIVCTISQALYSTAIHMPQPWIHDPYALATHKSKPLKFLTCDLETPTPPVPENCSLYYQRDRNFLFKPQRFGGTMFFNSSYLVNIQITVIQPVLPFGKKGVYFRDAICMHEIYKTQHSPFNYRSLFQDPQWMAETAYSIELYMQCAFLIKTYL